MKKKPVILAIVDGWGVAQDSEHNIIAQAQTPHIDRLMRQYPVMNLYASGVDVGLAFGTPGNAEVGHVNIGAGRIWCDLASYINTRIVDKTFFDNHVLVEACEYTKKNKSTLHIIGLLSTNDSHACLAHCYALLDLAKKYNIKNVLVHVILDGIDAPHDGGKKLVADLLSYMKKNKIGRIGSISGRFFAMDRDHYWNRTEQAYRAIVDGVSAQIIDDPLRYIQNNYDNGIADTDIVPAVLYTNGIGFHDSVIFFNIGSDRMRQLVESVVLPSFTHFERNYQEKFVVTMRDYEPEIPVRVAFPTRIVYNSLADVLSRAGKTQYHIADVERYPHVTYFFNGYISEVHEGETQEIITTSHILSDREKPMVNILEIKKAVIKAVESGDYDFIVCNFSNIDMFAHIDDKKIIKKSIYAIDKALGSIAEYVLATEGSLCITSSHGNDDCMAKEKQYQHNLNLVPCIMVEKKFFGIAGKAGDPPLDDISLLAPVGCLADIAPTILEIMGIEKPDEMTGKSLIT